jgi:hypothetical protein
VPSIQLPSYVDDVVEVANFAALPVTGETGKIYITLDNNKVYRWTGSIYVEIAANNAVWGAITGTLSNQTDLQNALNAKVPYTGATANVDLGTFDLTADVITGATGSFASSGGSDTFAINHSSGSGVALNITKGGNNEGLYINKTSGSGNAATIIGTLNATTLVKSGGTSSQFLKADGSVDASAYITLAALSATSPIFYNSTTGVISSQAASATLQGFVTTSSQTIAGVKTFSNGIVMDNGSSGVPLEFKQYASAGYSGTGYTSLFALNNSLCINFGNPSGFIILNTTTLTSNRTFTFQNASGTLALTSDLSAYLPLTGGTLTGALNGTSATFSSNEGLVINPSSGASHNTYKIGGTSYGLIGIAGSTNDLINGSALGDLNIRATNSQKILFSTNNGGSAAFTIASTGAATFSSSVTAGGAGAFTAAANGSPTLTLGTAGAVNAVINTADEMFFNIDSDNNQTEASFIFATNRTGTSGGSELVRFKDNGNVGIGTSSPSALLSLAKSLGNDVLTMGEDATSVRFKMGQEASYTGNYINSTNIDLKLQAYLAGGSGGNIIFQTGASGSGSLAERMRITSGGNVGIGTSSPRTAASGANPTLDVKGGIYFGSTAAESCCINNDDRMIFNIDADNTSTTDFFRWATNTKLESGGTELMKLTEAGNLTILGSISKGSGSFRIDHPLESMSETHQLVHSFVEAPQADLYYRGKLNLVNGKGQANIDEVATMTEGTFEALCREVQCFTTNETGWDLVKGKVIGNIIYIESQNINSTDEISWLVIGERKDKHMMDTEWTDENGRVIVEPLKEIETNNPIKEDSLDVEALDLNLDAQIENQVNPPIVVLPLPFVNP